MILGFILLLCLLYCFVFILFVAKHPDVHLHTVLTNTFGEMPIFLLVNVANFLKLFPTFISK